MRISWNSRAAISESCANRYPLSISSVVIDRRLDPCEAVARSSRHSGAAYLPIAYRKAYVQFVRDVIPSLLIRVKEIDRNHRYHYLERLLAPVYAHAPPCASHDIRPQLRRFL